jgi:hypothetical protein
MTVREQATIFLGSFFIRTGKAETGMSFLVSPAGTSTAICLHELFIFLKLRPGTLFWEGLLSY